MSQIFANMAHFSEWRTRLDIDNTPHRDNPVDTGKKDYRDQCAWPLYIV
jgi:hypothetical protein